MKVVFLGCTDNYGYGFSANVTKVGYMAKGLKEAGAECYIHNGVCGNRHVKQDEDIIVDGIPVTSLFKRGHEIYSWIFNLRKVYKYLKTNNDGNNQHIAIIEMDMYHIFIIYWFLCKITGYKLVAISHEWGPTVVEVNPIRRPSLFIYSLTFGWFVDAILPISEYIIEKIKHFKKPYFKVPILADFSDVDNSINNMERSHLVYCASVYYKRIIMMILSAYKTYLDSKGQLKLTLILNGPQDKIRDIQQEINRMNIQDNVVIKTKLPYSELLYDYRTAAALIIPLNPDIEQDSARFSQKIAEYLSSKSPIITNNVGEIKYYFNDDELLKCDYSIIGFSEAFRWIEYHKEKCLEIGYNGFLKGKTEFDYLKQGKLIYEFLAKQI